MLDNGAELQFENTQNTNLQLRSEARMLLLWAFGSRLLAYTHKSKVSDVPRT